MTDLRPDRPTWLHSDRRLARYVAQPVVRFLDVEAAGGVLLLVATALALAWANSPWSESYQSLWHTVLGIDIGSFRLEEDLGHWVNDGPMALFFFVIGLEIKSELVTGQLRSARAAALPVCAALGGMVVPALFFVALNASGEGAAGWGIPMATDIAFALGVLALLGSRIPSTLKVLLLGLAIADDLGAIIIIALFYTEQVSLGWLAGAVVGLGAVVVMRRSRIWFTPLYAIIGVAVWLCTLQSGVHATIAGVALGLLTPARPLMSELDAGHVTDHLSSDTDVTATEVRAVAFMIRESVSPAERFAHLLHPWTSYVIAPLFAFANAGIALSGEAIDQAIGSPVTAGVIIGLVGGKLVGITAFSWLAVRLGVAELPAGVTNRMIVGLAALAGVGFTVSMFITGLAYGDPDLQDQAKIGVLAGSAVGAVLGGLLLRSATAAKGSTTPALSGDEPAVLAPVHSAPQR